MFQTATHRLARLCELLAAALLAAVCVLNISQVSGRYLFGSSISWAEEIMRYTMLWVMMLGGTAAIYRGDHMAVETLIDLVGKRWRHLLRSALFAVAGIFCILLVWYGWPAALNNARQQAAASGLPMIVPYMAIPVGGALMLAQIVLCWVSGFAPSDPQEEA